MVRCCKCREAIKGDIYLLDGEWLRHYPTMVGLLACTSCALWSDWGTCQDAQGRTPAEHVNHGKEQAPDAGCDAWTHLVEHGDPELMLADHPDLALFQRP